MRNTPSDDDAGRREALALHRSGKLADAARLYGELLKKEPQDAELLGLSGLAEFQLGHEVQALAAWRASLSQAAPAQLRLRTIANIIAAVKARPSAGVAELLSGLTIPAWPKDAETNLDDRRMVIALARGLLTHGRTGAAIELLDSILPGLAADKDFIKAAAAILIDAGQAAKVAEMLRPLTDGLGAADGGLLAAHAAAAQLSGRSAEAQALIRRAIEAAPVHLTAKEPGQLMLVGVINPVPASLERAPSAAFLHFSKNTPASLAFRHNDEYRFLSVFPEAQSAAGALARLPKPDLILNNWVNGELLSMPRALEFIAGFVDNFGTPVINHPRLAAQTTRLLNAERLAGIAGLVVPRVIRSGNDPARLDEIVRGIGESIGFPLIIRGLFAQKGIGAEKLDTPEALARHLGRQPRSELYAIQYVDNPVASGVYRKMRAAVIGEEVFITHVHFGPAWNVHREHDKGKAEAFDPEGKIAAEARRITLNPEDALGREAFAALHEIRRRTPLEFYGIDFDLLPDGRLLFFEANATMHLSLADRAGLEQTRAAMRAAVRRLFQDRARKA